MSSHMILEIPMAKLQVSSPNTRKDLQAGQEDAGIDELAEDIKAKGLINPLTVRPLDDGTYEVVAGQRRFLACKKAGLDAVPCRFMADLTDTDAVVISLTENVQRADMNPTDKAKAFSDLLSRLGSVAEVAKRTGLLYPTVQKYIRLLDLP